MEVEGHEVYVSAPKWRLLFLGSGCNNKAYNYYVYTYREIELGDTTPIQHVATDGKYALDAKPRTLSNNKDTS